MFKNILALLAISVALPATASAQQFISFYGTAIDVYDGDMFTLRLSNSSLGYLERVLTQLELRTGTVQIQLQGIDAPERNNNHPYWRESRAHLMRLLNNQTVNVQILLTPGGFLNRSPAGIVGVARVGRSGRPVNLSLIEAGLAKDDWRVSFGAPYVSAQRTAMSRRLGIWSDPRQYEAENDFRIQLYGSERARTESKLAPYPDGKVAGNGKPETFARKSPFPNVGVGKQQWQKGFGDRKRPGVPQVKN